MFGTYDERSHAIFFRSRSNVRLMIIEWSTGDYDRSGTFNRRSFYDRSCSKWVWRLHNSRTYLHAVNPLKQQSNGPLYSNTVIGRPTLGVDGCTVTFRCTKCNSPLNFILFEVKSVTLTNLTVYIKWCSEDQNLKASIVKTKAKDWTFEAKVKTFKRTAITGIKIRSTSVSLTGWQDRW